MERNARNLGLLVIFLFLGLVIIIGGLLLFKNNQSFNKAPTIMLITPSAALEVETAKTDNERMIGLSSRNSLPGKGGMLFYFDQSSAENCFWMKDTKIPLDMVFIDSKCR